MFAVLFIFKGTYNICVLLIFWTRAVTSKLYSNTITKSFTQICHKYQLDFANTTSQSFILVCIVLKQLFNTHKNIYVLFQLNQSEKLSKCANKSSSLVCKEIFSWLHKYIVIIKDIVFSPLKRQCLCHVQHACTTCATCMSNMCNMHVQYVQHARPTCATCMSNSWHHQTQAFHFQHCLPSGSSIIVKMKSLLQTIFQSSYMEHRSTSCTFGQANTYPHTQN